MNYTFTGETKEFHGITVKRVKYDNGVIGGWIEKEENLDKS